MSFVLDVIFKKKKITLAFTFNKTVSLKCSLYAKGASVSVPVMLFLCNTQPILCQFCRLVFHQLQHAAEQENAEELPAGLQEGRRPRLHHVPACHHELPGQAPLHPPQSMPPRHLGAARTYFTGGDFNQLQLEMFSS